jgi:hypothetical protein
LPFYKENIFATLNTAAEKLFSDNRHNNNNNNNNNSKRTTHSQSKPPSPKYSGKYRGKTKTGLYKRGNKRSEMVLYILQTAFYRKLQENV